MTAHSAKSQKAKGRRLQQYFRDRLVEELGIDPLDIKSTGMGQAGLDIYLSREARDRFPYGIECKNTETLQFWAMMRQCEANAKKEGLIPMGVVHRNNSKTYAVLELDELLKILRRAYR